MTKNQLNEDDPKLKLIDARLEKIREEIKQACASCGRSPEEITVMAVTKTVAPVYINYAVKKGGLTILGENRAQELCEKYDDYLLKREHIHFIGHLQTNKVRQIIDKVSMIQSVDSLKLAKEIDLQAKSIICQWMFFLKLILDGKKPKAAFCRKICRICLYPYPDWRIFVSEG